MGALKPWHIIVLVVVLVLLFGAKRLPDAARSLGRSLRIIKAETRGLSEDDDVAEKAEAQYGRRPRRAGRLAADYQPVAARSAEPTSSRGRCDPVAARPRQLSRPADGAGPAPSRRQRAQFERAADGSMTLIEHIRELRSRLFMASLGVVVGLIVGFLVSQRGVRPAEQAVLRLAEVARAAGGMCTVRRARRRATRFVLQLKIALWVGLIVGRAGLALPAVGVHRARPAPARAPLGLRLRRRSPRRCSPPARVLAYFVVATSLPFLLQARRPGVHDQLEITATSASSPA